MSEKDAPVIPGEGQNQAGLPDVLSRKSVRKDTHNQTPAPDPDDFPDLEEPSCPPF